MNIEIVSIRERPFDEQTPEANPYVGIAKIDNTHYIRFTSPVEDAEPYLHTIEPLLQSLIDKGKYLDAETVRAIELLATSPAVIKMPEIWEIIRIFGKKLGYRGGD